MPHVIALKDGKLLTPFGIRDLLDAVQDYAGEELRREIESYIDTNVEDIDDYGLYDMLRKDLLIPLKDGDIDAANAASLTGKLLQMSNGAVYDENGKARVIHDHKLEALEDLIEAANGQPVLVAYWFKHDRQRIMEHLSKQKIPVRDIKSSTDIKDWNARKIPVALIHPASAGHGLNIQQGGHILIWFGLTWSLELYQQTNARLWRQGQTDVVTIHHIITKDTVDEDVMRHERNIYQRTVSHDQFFSG